MLQLTRKAETNQPAEVASFSDQKNWYIESLSGASNMGRQTWGAMIQQSFQSTDSADLRNMQVLVSPCFFKF
jgi:hypothetical protein